jgi:hypothetical protein
MHICAKAASAAYWSIVSRPARLLFVVSSVAVLKLSEPSFLFRQHCPCARAAVAFRSVCIISPCHHASVRIRGVHSQLRARLSHRAPKGTKKKMAARFHRKNFPPAATSGIFTLYLRVHLPTCASMVPCWKLYVSKKCTLHLAVGAPPREKCAQNTTAPAHQPLRCVRITPDRDKFSPNPP